MRKLLTGAIILSMTFFNIALPNYKLSSWIVNPTDCYTYEQVENDLAALAKRFPKSLTVMEYGVSREGRKLYAAVAGDIGAKHSVLIQAGIHGREHMTTTLVMAQLEYLLRRSIPKNICFYMIPSSSPDGAYISQSRKSTTAIDAMYESDIASGRYKRSKDNYLLGWKANAAGVDLNRNFNALWENIRSSYDASSENYRGPYVVSEPETKALVELTQTRHFDATISYHATGSEVYYAFGDNKNVNDMGYSLAVKVNKRLKYDIVPDGGTSFGGYKDWAIEALRIPSLTIEIGKGKAPLKYSEWPDIWKRNANLPYDAAEWIMSK